MKPTTYIVLDYKHNTHRIQAVSLTHLFKLANEMGVEVYDYEVEEGEDFA
jgi:hypothetical protein